MLSLFGLLPLLAVSAVAAPAPHTERAACSITWKGQTLTGATDGNACRYTVKYGSASRWAHSSAARSTPSDASKWPPRCPQAHAYPAATDAQSEDCLYLTIWAPSSSNQNSQLPVYVYAPGGSNIEGGAADDGIDGAGMASQGLVVVHAQTRLGVLGFLPPSWLRVSDPNFALRDMLLALRSVKDNIVGAGGNPSAVTLGGQSAGALVVQAMLGVPEAAGLFQRIILQSGPLNAGTQSAAQTTALQKLFYQDILGCRDARCAQDKTAAQLMTATGEDLVSSAQSVEGVSYVAFVRPVFGTKTLPKDPSNVLFNNPSQLAVKPKEVLVTTLLNEGGAGAAMVTPQPGGGPLSGNIEARGRGGKGRQEKDSHATYVAKIDLLFEQQRALCDQTENLRVSELGPWEEKWQSFYDQIVAASAEYTHTDVNDPENVKMREEMRPYTLNSQCPYGNFLQPGPRPERRNLPRDISPAEVYLDVLRVQLGSRAEAVAAQYPLPAGIELGSAMTAPIERVFTDGGFRCPSRALAAKFATIATTYVGEFTKAGNHANNEYFAYCKDHACHMDDVYAWWGTGPTGSDAFSQDVQGRVATFVKNGNPGSGWSKFNDGSVFAIGGGETQACPAGFWGEKVKFDFQLYSQ